MRKAFILLALLAVAPVQAQISPGLLAVLLSGKPRLPGNQSFLYLAKDSSTLKTDIAGTTAVASAGDTVGTWLDGSGNGYTVTAAADDTTRPTYQIRSGKPYVAGDGSNDLLYSTTAPNLYGTSGGNNFTICIAYRYASPAGGKTIVDESDANSTNSIGSYIRSLSATPAHMSISMRGSDGATNITSTGLTVISNANDGNDHVLCYVRNGTVLTPYLDGVASGTVAVTATAFTANQINLFARYRARTSAPGVNIDAWAAVDLYGVVAWKSDQTASIPAITAYMRALYP